MANRRIAAIDICKGIAVLGMMFMNFKITVVESFQIYSDYNFLTSMEGRFGVLFIFMAGVGLSLMTSRARQNEDSYEMNLKRLLLAKRALFLFSIGMIFSLYWQADILHFYAFYILCAIPFLTVSCRALITAAVISTAISVVLHLLIEWDSGWDFTTLSYSGFYTPVGFLRNILFNGFHPLFPWLSFLYVGMVIGRYDLNNSHAVAALFKISSGVFILIELFTALVIPYIENELAATVMNTIGFPATPGYVVSSCAMAAALLSATVLLVEKMGLKKNTGHGLALLGKTVMTQYVFHLIIGVPLLFVLNEFFAVNVIGVAFYSLGYYVVSLAVTVLWKRRFELGPLEMLMRRVTG